jgi:MFS family permease
MPALAVLCAAQFVVVLDVTIVAVALPAIQRDLGFSAAGLQWVVTAYTLVFAGLLIAAGRAADLHGRRRAFMAGLGLFAAASLACGLARAPGVLVAARAVQGLGAAAVAPAALATITATVPDGPVRQRALGVWTAAAAGGGATGWLLGGVLTEHVGWPAVFLVNVPIGALGVALAPLVVPETRAPGRRRRLDVPGALTVTVALAVLVLGLTAPAPRVAAGALVLAAALLVAFARIETRAADPLLPAHLLRCAPLTAANLVAAALTAATTPPLFLCVLEIQHRLGGSPTHTGLLFVPVNLSVIAGSLLGPRAVRAAGARAAMAAGLALVAAGALWLLGGGGSLARFLPAFVAMGLGLGCASVASTAVGTAAAGQAREGVASGLLTTAAQVGTVVGLAALVGLATAAGDRAAFVAAAVVAGAGAGAALGLVRPGQASS